MRLHSLTIRATLILDARPPATPDASADVMTAHRTTSAVRRTTWALLCLALCAGSSAAAQRIPSSYRHVEDGQGAGVFAGYLNLTRGQWELGPKSAPYAGGRYAIELSGPLFAEGLLSYLPTARDVVDPRRAEGDRTIGETDVHLFMADARLAFSATGRRTWRRIAPHIFVGVGVVLDAAGLGEAEDVLQPEDRFELGTTFKASAGAGVRIAPARRIMLHLEGGMALWRLTTPSGFGDPSKGLENVAEREWVRGLGVTLGAAYRF